MEIKYFQFGREWKGKVNQCKKAIETAITVGNILLSSYQIMSIK